MSNNDDPMRLVSDEEVARMLESCEGGVREPEHLLREMEAARWRGRHLGRPIPLPEGAPVPGCDCPDCTGVRAAGSARRQGRERGWRDLRPAVDVDIARAVPVTEIARRLGLERSRKMGRELVVRCPLHDDRRPSLRIDPRKNVWYCDPCAEGGDGIRLYMRALNVGFVEAVRELAGRA